MVTEIEVFQKRNMDEICSDNIIEIETTINIKFKKEGMHVLKFKQNDATYLVDSVYIVK